MCVCTSTKYAAEPIHPQALVWGRWPRSKRQVSSRKDTHGTTRWTALMIRAGRPGRCHRGEHREDVANRALFQTTRLYQPPFIRGPLLRMHLVFQHSGVGVMIGLERPFGTTHIHPPPGTHTARSIGASVVPPSPTGPLVAERAHPAGSVATGPAIPAQPSPTSQHRFMSMTTPGNTTPSRTTRDAASSLSTALDKRLACKFSSRPRGSQGLSTPSLAVWRVAGRLAVQPYHSNRHIITKTNLRRIKRKPRAGITSISG